MDGRTIIDLLGGHHETSTALLGVYPADRLPSRLIKRPSLVIINTDTSYRPGKHWLAVYLRGDGRYAEFFDPYGKHYRAYHEAIGVFVERNGSFCVKVQQSQLQNRGSTSCGYFCVFYSLLRANGLTMDYITKLFTEYMNSNEAEMIKFVKTYHCVTRM